MAELTAGQKAAQTRKANAEAKEKALALQAEEERLAAESKAKKEAEVLAAQEVDTTEALNVAVVSGTVDENAPLPVVPQPTPEETEARLEAATATGPQAGPTWGFDPDSVPLHEGKDGGVADLYSEDLIRQNDGQRAPLSATTENLQGTVSGDIGRVIVKIANYGYIGEEPVVLLGSQVAELKELFEKLEEAAKLRISERQKS